MVMILSNEPNTASLLRIVLAADGFEVFETSATDISLPIFESLHPDMVVVDLNQMAMNEPLNFVSALRQRDHQVGIILCTAVYSSRFENDLTKAGVDNVLRKPFSLETLRRQIRQVGMTVSKRKKLH